MDNLREARMIRAIDGDTYDIEFAAMPGDMFRVRIIGIDCPEVRRNKAKGIDDEHVARGKAAKQFVVNLLPPGSTIWIASEGRNTDLWGRLRRHIWFDNKTQNLANVLLETGHAIVYVWR